MSKERLCAIILASIQQATLDTAEQCAKCCEERARYEDHSAAKEACRQDAVTIRRTFDIYKETA